MKRKYLLPIIATCMAVAVLAVGFAGWLITGADTTDIATGNFETYGVENRAYKVTIEATAPGTSDKIIFGRPADADNTGWLKYDGTVKVESLVATFVLKVTPEGSAQVADIVTDDIKVTLVLPNEYTTAKDAGYVAAVTMAATDVADATYADNVLTLPATVFDSTSTVTITVTFDWGTKGNPYTYYKTQENNEGNRKAAGDLLEAVYALNEATYTLELSVGAGTGAGA